MSSYINDKNYLDRPILSFIVASYNVSKSLERCLESIINQSLDNFEVIVVNDRSTDNTLEIAQFFAEKDKKNRIKVISHICNRGLAAVRNTGLFASRGKYIWHIDGDDYLGYENAAKFIIQIFSKEKVSVIKFGVYNEMKKNDFSTNCKRDYSELEISYKFLTPSELLKTNGLGGVFGYVFNRDLAIEVGIRSLEGVNIGEDQIFLSQIYKIVPSIVEIKNYFYVYDKTESSLMRSKWNFERFLEDRVYTYFAMEIFGIKSHNFECLAKSRLAYVIESQLKKAKNDLSEALYKLLNCIYLEDYLNFIKTNKLKSLPVRIIKNYNRLLRRYNYSPDNVTPCLTDSSIIKYLLKDVEFFIHLGVHNTATNFIQTLLEKNKNDLALQGILIVDINSFRKFVDNIEIEKSDENIYGFIIKAILPRLFVKPKKIIISDQNLLFPNRLDTQFKNKLSKISACSPWGFDLNLIKKLVKIIPNTKLFISIRDYKDYIISLHTKMCIRDGYFNIENALEDWDFENYCNWNFVLKKLEGITNSANNSKLLITKYEDYKDDPSVIASLLAGVKLKSTEELNFNSIELKENIASSETINIIESYKKEQIDKESVDNLYKKLINSNYGSSEYIPEFFKNNSSYRDLILNKYTTSNSYQLHCSEIDFINISHELSKINQGQNGITFKSITNFKNISKNSIKEKYEDYQKRSFSTFFNQKIIKNIENNPDYFYFRDSFKPKKGISAMLRVKNEEKNIKNVLLGIVKVFDEIILVDNNSLDNTLLKVQELIDNNEEFRKKIKVYNYPFDIAKCGTENFNTHPSSLNSLCYFYNYSLSKCNFRHVMKWDGDMLLPSFMRDDFRSFIETLIENKNSVIGLPKGLKVFRGFDGNYYFRPNSFEKEIRIFNNIVDNYFVKDVLFERLQNNLESQFIDSKGVIFIDYKDVSTNEFSNWNEGYLGIGNRKRNELRDYKIISDITSSKNREISSLMEALGFKTLKEEEIFK